MSALQLFRDQFLLGLEEVSGGTDHLQLRIQARIELDLFHMRLERLLYSSSRTYSDGFLRPCVLSRWGLFPSFVELVGFL
jgi:hypothetical protein